MQKKKSAAMHHIICSIVKTSKLLKKGKRRIEREAKETAMSSHGQKTHSFHRFIHSDDTNQITIRIPNKFIREHRKNILLNNVAIIVSDDKLWPLDWMVSGDGKLWLQKGWPEFAEHYSLKTGYLLLFNHHGQSLFHVRIFDQSSCEISYPPPEKPATWHKEIHPPVIEEEDDDDQIIATPETQNFQEIKASEKRSRNRVKSFKSDNPFYSVTMTASYYSWGLYVSTPFMRRYLLSGDEECVDCVLEVSDGRRWGPIKCRDHKTYGKFYGCNWNKFRDENHVRVGDVCVFELMNEMEKVLKVTIFRA